MHALALLEMGKDIFDATVDTNILLVREGRLRQPIPSRGQRHPQPSRRIPTSGRRVGTNHARRQSTMANPVDSVEAGA